MLRLLVSYDKNDNIIQTGKQYDFLPLREILEDILANSSDGNEDSRENISA